MPDSQLQQVIQSSTVVVHPGRYAYLKCDTTPSGNHFLVTQDADEVTVVTQEQYVVDVPHTETTKWFKLLEIKVSMPFVATGFLATVTSTIADKGLNVLIVSTYSKDYALVREETAETAIEALRDVGFPVQID
jgi:hypothetical protein